MKYIFFTFFLIFLNTNSIAFELRKGNIYISNISIHVGFKVLELSGKIDGFYCRNGKLKITIRDDDNNFATFKIKRHDFNGYGNWIEGVAKKNGDFEKIKSIDFTTECYDK
jgi:hypothetical protein